MRAMAIDYGERRIGVAITDATGSIALPLETIRNTPRRDGSVGAGALDRIAELVEFHQVTRIVIGLPLHMDGRIGDQAKASRRFGDRVTERTGIPIEYLDERLSSLEAERVLERGGVRSKERRGKVDPIAASLILQTWLGRRAD